MKLLLYLNFFALALYSYCLDLHSTHIVHTWSQILSRERIVTSNVNFKRMNKEKLNVYITTKALVVVLIPHLEALLEFSNVTKNLKMSFPKWLVIFLQTSSNEEHNYCHEPVGNPFNLAFNTEMLVLCHDDNILREWYSMDTRATEIVELATYDTHRGIVLRTNLSVYERRKDMKGMTLRVLAMKNMVESGKKNGKFRGFVGDVFNELAQTLNFTTKIVKVSTEYGSFNSTTHAWSGALAEFASGHADIGVGGFVMTGDRLDVVDFLIPLMVSRECLFIKKPEFFRMQWFAYSEAFSPAIWLSISTIIIIFSVILISIKKYCGSANNVRTISEEFLQILGIFCQQGLTEYPVYSWLRIGYFTLFATAIVVSAAYSASLIRFLTTRIPFLPFLTIDEFIENGSYDLIAVRGSAQYDAIAKSENPVSVGLMKLMRPYDTLPKDTWDSFQSICKDSKVALYSTDFSMKSLRSFIPCEISVISTGVIVSFSLILSKNSPYTSGFNHQLLKFQSNGLLKHFMIANYPLVEYDRDTTFQAVEIFNVITVLAIFAGGVLLSIIILIMETLYYNYTYRKKSNNSLNTQEQARFEFLE